MYSLADHFEAPAAELDPIERELNEIEELRRRALANRDILYCSPLARHLVESEIPRLLEIIRDLRRSASPENGPAGADRWLLGALDELRREIGIVRDLIDRR